MGTFTLTGESKAEGSGGGVTPFVFTVTRTSSTAVVESVDYNINGFLNLASPSDVTGATTGSVTFGLGDLTKTFTISVVADNDYEAGAPAGNEGIVVFAQQGQTIVGTTTATFLNDDGVILTGQTVNEGNAGTTTLRYTVTAAAPAPVGGISFDIATVAGGTATSGTDYVARSLVGQTIAAGQTTYTFDVTVNGDTQVEPDETVNVQISNLTGTNGGVLSAIGTITNDDAAPVPAPVPAGVPAPAGNYTVNGQAYIDRDYVAPMGDRVDAIYVQDQSTTNAINITGNASSQTITGNNGANLINGFGGNDTMVGLGGNDTYLVRGPGDVVIEANGGGTDTVFTTVSYNLGANEVEVLSTVTNSDTSAINLTGNFATQTIVGNYGDNVLNGGSGGLDTLIGLRGNDIYAVGDSRTVIVENAGEGSDTVVTSVDYTLAAGVSVEVLAAQDRAGTTSLALRGNEIAQIIVGNNGANILDGGLGSDTLAGGGGADSFRFTTALGVNNVDSVVDFESIDKIGLGAGIFGLTSVTAVNFTIGTAATTADQRIVYNQATGQLFFDADGNGAGAAVLFAMFAPNTVLAAANFEIV